MEKRFQIADCGESDADAGREQHRGRPSEGRRIIRLARMAADQGSVESRLVTQEGARASPSIIPLLAENGVRFAWDITLIRVASAVIQLAPVAIHWRI